MSRIKMFFLNRGSTIAYAIVSAIFTLTPEDLFKKCFFCCSWSDVTIILVNRIIVCLFVFLLANITFFIWRKNRKAVYLTDNSISIEIKYGDLTVIREGKKVISFDECYSTNVGDRPEDIKPESVCGQYLKNHPIDNIQNVIKKAGIHPSSKSLFKGKAAYTPGTLIPRDDYLLLAFAKLDANGLGNHTYDSYLKCLDKLWEQIDLYHGTDDVYLPVLGSRITRFEKELSQQELLDIMIASYRLSPKKMRLPNCLHIICKEREGFSLNDVLGID